MRERPAIARLEKIDQPADIVRPFVWTAALFFSRGFGGYLAIANFIAR